MIRLYTIFASILISSFAAAQVVVTNPALPIDNQQLTITFDATQGNKGLVGFTGDVYAYTGVITDKSTSNSNWLYVKEASWTDNPASCKMTRIDANHYSLSLTPSIREFYGVPAGEKIKKMAFVFHCPCPTTGEPSGRDVGGADILVDVFEPILNVSIAQPSNYFNLVQNNQTFNVIVNASNNDSICLFLDNTKVLSSKSQSLNYSLTATGTNKHTLIATAYKGTQNTSDTAYYLVKGTTQNVPIPAGTKDGIHYPDNQSANFILFAPYKSSVYLLGDFNNWIPDNNFLMKKDGDRFWVTLTGLKPGQEYVFQYLIDDTIRIADPYSEKISDPGNDKFIPSRIYPDLISYPTGKTTGIAGVIQPGQTPYPWQITNFIPPAKEKLVVYELLIRDFTANKDIKTVTDTLVYLKRLGINAIELMPFSEFDGNDSWGYNPCFYFAPDKAYGTREDYKKFIDVCHQNGIAVIQDMVLDFSTNNSPLVQMYFANGKPTVQNPWYNVNSPNTAFVFGNVFNHDSPYTRKLTDSITSFWMSQYKIDGFRFDFAKGWTNTVGDGFAFDQQRITNLEFTADHIWKQNPNAYVILELFTSNIEETILSNYGMMIWGNMNQAYGQATMSYNNSGGSWDFSGISYKNPGWNNPTLIGYMESHDEEREMYRNVTFGNASGNYSIKDTTTALKRMELANTFFITVPGPKMIWQFGELGYDIAIDFNGRVGDKPVKWSYDFDARRRHLYNVVKALINIKQEEPVFSTNTFTLDVSGAIKRIELLDATTMVEIVGNFDVTDHTFILNFPSSGIWYEFFRGDSVSLAGPSLSLTLKAGEYRLYATKKLTGFASVPTAINRLNEHFENAVYPNPFSSELYINDYTNIKNLEILNSQGKTQWQSGALTSNVISTSNLLPGLYFIKIRQKNGEERLEKVMKL